MASPLPDMTKHSIHTDQAPQAIGPYSQAIAGRGLLFVSGQIPLDPETGKLVGDSIEAQTRRVMDNLDAILRAAGTDFSRLVKTTIYLTDLAHFPQVNQTYGSYLPEPFPARATVQVAALPLGAAVEIDAVALLPTS